MDQLLFYAVIFTPKITVANIALPKDVMITVKIFVVCIQLARKLSVHAIFSSYLFDIDISNTCGVNW